jgi:S-adenosylmethionine hydrolase
MIITLLTDFGTADGFAASMKGVILSINPKAVIVDITHEIGPHNIREAAFILETVYRYFPKGTIHVAVVDPGVGSARRPLVAVTPQAVFVAPDNGVLTTILNENPKARSFQITEPKYRLTEHSPTFDGRDRFAPAAAHLSKGVKPERFGRRVTDPVIFLIPEPKRLPGHRLQGLVVHTDRFGNLITNITVRELEPWLSAGRPVSVTIQNHTIKGLKAFYSQAAPGEPAALINSDGRLEIFVSQSSAAAMLRIPDDAEVVIE